MLLPSNTPDTDGVKVAKGDADSESNLATATANVLDAVAVIDMVVDAAAALSLAFSPILSTSAQDMAAVRTGVPPKPQRGDWDSDWVSVLMFKCMQVRGDHGCAWLGARCCTPPGPGCRTNRCCDRRCSRLLCKDDLLGLPSIGINVGTEGDPSIDGDVGAEPPPILATFSLTMLASALFPGPSFPPAANGQDVPRGCFCRRFRNSDELLGGRSAKGDGANFRSGTDNVASSAIFFECDGPSPTLLLNVAADADADVDDNDADESASCFCFCFCFRFELNKPPSQDWRRALSFRMIARARLRVYRTERGNGGEKRCVECKMLRLSKTSQLSGSEDIARCWSSRLGVVVVGGDPRRMRVAKVCACACVFTCAARPFAIKRWYV